MRRQYASGVLSTQSYDPAGNLSGITNNGPAALVSRLAYAYNRADKRTSQAEADGTVTTWSYDRAYQLLNESRSGGPANTSFNLSHAYDPAGNRTVFDNGTTVTTYSYSPANRLTLANAGGSVTTYAYDAAGHRTAERPASGPRALYNWDASGRMVSADLAAGIATFTYNADGQRAAKVGTDHSVTGYLYDYKRLLHETDAADAVTRTYASGTDEEFGDLIGEGDGQAHVYDAQANTEALLDATGTVEARYKYTAFGEVDAVSLAGGVWSREDWATLPLELSTHMLAGGRKQYYLDMETALYLLGSGNTDGGRYYDPSTARFLSEDPKRQQGGDPNLYPYVQNDPVNKLDPGGHETEEEKRKREEEEREQQEAAARAQQAKESATHEGQAADSSKESGSTPVAKAPAGGDPSSSASSQSDPHQSGADQPAPKSPEASHDSKPTAAQAGDSAPPAAQAPALSPGTLRLAQAVTSVGMDLPPEVAKDPQFRSVLAMADEYYAKANTDPNRAGFKNLDDYVATQLYLKTSGPVRDWLERASGVLSTQSAEGRAAIAAKQQGYEQWAKEHTGWRGYLNDQLSIAKAGAEGAQGGLSIVANTLSHGLSDKLHVTDSEQYQGKDYRVARVTALIGREALEFAAGAEIGKLAEGGYRAAQLVNRVQQVQALYQSGEQAKEGLEQIAKDPLNWHGPVNLIVGMGGAALGAHGLGGELKAADKVVSEVSTAEKVVKEAGPLEKAASQATGEVAKEAGAAEKAVTKAEGQVTKEAESAAQTEKAAARTESPAASSEARSAAPEGKAPTAEEKMATAAEQKPPAAAEKPAPSAASSKGETAPAAEPKPAGDVKPAQAPESASSPAPKSEPSASAAESTPAPKAGEPAASRPGGAAASEQEAAAASAKGGGGAASAEERAAGSKSTGPPAEEPASVGASKPEPKAAAEEPAVAEASTPQSKPPPKEPPAETPPTAGKPAEPAGMETPTAKTPIEPEVAAPKPAEPPSPSKGGQAQGIENDEAAKDVGLPHAEDDLLRGRLGPASTSHPEEYAKTMETLENKGVTVDPRPGHMAYLPEAGKPGKLLLDPEASIGALRHEVQHVLDVEAEGFKPFSHYLANPGERWRLEFRAYMQEVKIARSLRDFKIGRAIVQQMRQVRVNILGEP